jgi:hypothetical protein
MPPTAFFVDLRQKGLHRFLASGVSFKDGDSGLIESISPPTPSPASSILGPDMQGIAPS